MSERTSDGGDSGPILERWPTASAPAGFADLVLDKAASAPPPPARRRIAPFVVGALVAVAAIALLVWRGGEPEREAGARIARARETLHIGRRAVAVAEPDAVLAWRTDGGGATVEQSLGSVFYRVERGDQPFAVVTPAGRVTVAGTCFRVDVAHVEDGPMMKSTLAAAGAGAALAAIVTVAVYEGAVTAENDSGSTRVAAGQRAVLSPGLVPAVADGRVAMAEPTPAPVDATMEELRASEEAYRGQVTQLRRRVAQLERALGDAPRPEEPGQPPRDKHSGFTPEELAWMAKKCELRYDIPRYAMELGSQIDARDAKEGGLTDAELAAVNAILAEGDNRLVEQMKELYVELTGDRVVADALSPRNLQHEIFQKSRPGDLERALQRLSAERAGLARPPADLSELAPVERLLRLLTRAGDQYQERLAAAIGSERAADLRRSGTGMGGRNQSGCPD